MPTSRPRTPTSPACASCMSRSRCATPTSTSSASWPSRSRPGKVPDVWTVKLRPGVTFHNGKPVTAEDVIFSLQRIINPKNPGTGAASIGYIDLEADQGKLDSADGEIALTIPNIGLPRRHRPVLQRDRARRLQPEGSDRDGAVQVPELHPGPAERVRAQRGLLERPAARRLGDDHRLRRRHGEGQRAARGPGPRDHQPARRAAHLGERATQASGR